MGVMPRSLCGLLLLVSLLAGCAKESAPAAEVEGQAQVAIQLTSPAFSHEGLIPEKHTCDGADLSPELAWSGLPADAEPPTGGVHGKNSFGRLGYGGPCPPPGMSHRYYFRLYALDTELGLAAGASRQDVVAAMEGHILAQGELMGTYQR
jgi:phosphatidylethanolamine-binding protein (PEBP) family uncharacterized protein